MVDRDNDRDKPSAWTIYHEAGMTTVTTREAADQLSDLIARPEAGEEILIIQDDEPVAKLVALPRARANRPSDRRRVFGSMRGKFACPPDAFFFDPLPEDELKLWEGGGDDDDLMHRSDDVEHGSGITKDKP